MKYDSNLPDIINIGSGEEITIKDLVSIIAKKLDFRGNISFDKTRPDGTTRKLLDSTKIIETGWAPSISLNNGLDQVIASYIDKFSNLQ